MDGKVVASQIVDQPVRRHRLPEMDQEIGQQGADLGLGNLGQSPVVRPHGHGAEQPETHLVRIPAMGAPRRDRQPATAGWSA